MWHLETQLEREERLDREREKRVLRLVVIAFFLFWLLMLFGCSAGPGPGGASWHVWAPTTWPIFSGASTVTGAAKADAKADALRASVDQVQTEATHAAHLEITKADLTLGAIVNPSPEVIRARRFTRNGLGLLDQIDPLPAFEVAEATALVAGLTSPDAAKVKAAEHRQLDAEVKLGDVSKRVTAAEEKAGAAETKARQANVSARVAAMENIDLANELRSYKWALGWLLLIVVVGGALLFYVRLQLGGVGAALHAAGAPADVIAKINENTSALGQWFVRTGRQAAAKVAAIKGAL